MLHISHLQNSIRCIVAQRGRPIEEVRYCGGSTGRRTREGCESIKVHAACSDMVEEAIG